jgi:ketosteroid isomerase-like protein
MAEHPNIAVVRKGFDAFAKADMTTLTEVVDENVVWHSPPGVSPISGDFKGRDDTFAMFAKLFELSGGTLVTFPVDMAASGDNVYVQIEGQASRNGIDLKNNGIMRFRVVGGRAVEVWSYSDDVAANEAFWS